MLRLPPILILALATTVAAAAEPADPLKSAACEQAMQRLQRQETLAASAPQARPLLEPRPDGRVRPPDARVQNLRREAARICLGSRPDVPQPPPPQRRVEAPISGWPVVPTPPAPPPGAARPAPPSTPPAAIPRSTSPTVITSCDPTGCWASDGSRLNRMGPNLLGPTGLCSVQGNLLQCP